MIDPGASAPAIELSDPLAELLGALPAGGTFRYGYEDAVKLSGHSCPTVAGAYLMTLAALRRLYGDATPVRGQIEVTMGGAPDDGSAGPMAQVIAMVTGAAPETGFAGLMGRHKRRGLMTFDPKLERKIRFRRADTGASVDVSYDPAGIPFSSELGPLMTAALLGRANAADRERLADLWQARVAQILASADKVVSLSSTT